MYLAIADALARDVAAGALVPGTQLPTHRALARELGVNVVTVTRAYAEAARRGLVGGEVGRGTFVRADERAAPSSVQLRPEGNGLIDFHFNLPAFEPAQLAAPELFGELSRDGFDPFRAGYVPAGLEDHRAAGAEWLTRAGLEVGAERVFVTSGGQHSMSVAFAALTGPGEVVLTGELTYPGMKALAGVLNLRLVPVAMDADGILPDALEHACRKVNAKVLYCMPTLQNPTGVVWPEERRRAVLEIARKYGLTIVEDDTTSYLFGDTPPPLATLAPDLVLFVSSTSKSLAPGLRVGYLVSPPADCALAERLEANLAAISWMTPPLMAEITTRLIRSGRAGRVVEWKRKEAMERRELFERTLGHLETPSRPDSSFVWVLLPDPWRSQDFVAEARRAGVAVTPAEAFVVGRAHAPHAVRICLATPPSRAEVERGIDALTRIVVRGPDVCRPLA